MEASKLKAIKEKYPNTNTEELARELNISIYQLRRIVSKYKIRKSDTFKKQMYTNLHQNKQRAYKKNIPQYIPTPIQENIIIGSLLGDGNLACYGRSKESHYREHGCKAQANYRKWKAEMLSSLDFKYFPEYNAPCIKSPSNPLFSYYHNLFYKENRKQVSPEILKKLNHPLGLLCLYLDDGSLVVDRYIRKKAIHLFPRITIYSQSFTEKENTLLMNHLYKMFKIQFILKQRKDGHGVVLQCNYRDDIINFLDIIKTSHPLLTCMNYKLDLKTAMLTKKEHYKKLYPNHQIILDRYVL